MAIYFGAPGPIPPPANGAQVGATSLKPGRPALPPAPEAAEQTALFEWAELTSRQYPPLRLLYHVPNEGKRSAAEGARLRAQGLRRGVPDICLPVAVNGFHGLYIELKRERGGRVSDDQQFWLDALMEQGYFVALCRGWERAAGVIMRYLRGEYSQTEAGE